MRRKKKVNLICTKFLSLEPEKQARILNSALKEFVLKGYAHASTNEIVKEANISKGLLFHYFKSKKDLFLFLYDYTLDIFAKDFIARIDLTEKDIFVRWRQIALIKIELITKYPDLFDFILKSNLKDLGEVKEDLEKKNQEFITTNLQRILGDLDLSQFKPGIDIKKAIDTVVWTIEGFSAREQNKAKRSSLSEFDYNQILEDMDGYLELLRNCFYK